MKKEKSISTSFQVDMTQDKSVIIQNETTTRIIEIKITPPLSNPDKNRPPLNLSLVLDHSGSMEGEKLHFVKLAAGHVLDLLNENDHGSVVVFDNQVEIVIPAQNMSSEHRALAKEQINKVHPGGSTFLSGGWLKGCEQVAIGATQKTVNRTLLLTDGLANVGIKDESELAKQCKELFSRGISTSCFGVGNGYDEHLLEGMSNNGGGNFHFLETINAIPLVFEREFDELLTTSLKDTEIIAIIPTGVEVEPTAGWPIEKDGTQISVRVGSLYSGQSKSIYFKLKFVNIQDNSVAIPIAIHGKAMDETIVESVHSLVFKAVSSEEENAQEHDTSLMERFAVVDMADKANEAMKMERRGDRRGASSLLKSSLKINSPFMSNPMENKYEYLSGELSAGISIDNRKRYHREEYENKRGKMMTRDYYLKIVNGHLIAQIEGKSVLIDTGIPITIGSEPKWHFLNEVFTLSTDYMGVTCEYVTKMVGTQVDILMGCDILQRYFVLFDEIRKSIHFSVSPFMTSGLPVCMADFMGVPSIECTLDEKTQQMFLDTGAKLSYVSQKIATLNNSIGKEHDFYPGLGEFETDVYEIPMVIGTTKVILRCGVLPPALDITLLVTGKVGIIGSDLFCNRRIEIAFPRNLLVITENH